MTIADRKSNYTTSGMTVNLLSTADTTHATIAGGDFLLKADAQGTYTRTLNALGAIAKELKSQIKNKEINQSALKAKLPVASVILKTGSTNIISNILSKNGIAFKNANIDLKSSPLTGLNGTAIVDSLVYNDQSRLS